MSQIQNVAPERVFPLLQSRLQGLTAGEAAERLQEAGRNTLGAARRFSWVRSLFRQLTNFFSLLLDVAAALCFVADSVEPDQGMNILGGRCLASLSSTRRSRSSKNTALSAP